jgi:hypothetical protein
MKAVFRAMICLTVICLIFGLRPDLAVMAGFPPQKLWNPDQPQFQENARLVPQVPGNPQRVVAILMASR